MKGSAKVIPPGGEMRQRPVSDGATTWTQFTDWRVKVTGLQYQALNMSGGILDRILQTINQTIEI